ncbi:diacylglycerol/lipid kinase family protein [Desulfogranum japonicum]|uniref:diacylglycerol/lipid kinase family protein n=1 Tax=Desulfogranum japonicum TaxID=231447 RepID=UPI0003F64014|nr:diacylglycerol kinase family protein [Desulfogranum japonicum]
MKYPVFINPGSGNGSTNMDILQQDKRLDTHILSPDKMHKALLEHKRKKTPRVLVCGGDGTLGLSASALQGSTTELAVLPGGTLNHFAQRMGVPSNLDDALELALAGKASAIDVGTVNGRVFLNTSSVGAYVQFVRTRNHLEKRMSYSLASLVAGIRRLLRLRSARIQLDSTLLRSPLVFVGVGERELAFPFLGAERHDGRNGLHLIALKSKGRLETLNIALNAIFRGIDPLKKTRDVEARMVESVCLQYKRKKRSIYVALDGELCFLQAPLQYEYVREALLVVSARP